jgi:spore germination protein GerM
VSPRRANVLVALSLILLLGVVSFTAPRWSQWLRRPLPAADLAPERAGEAAPSRQAEAAREPDRKISVKLFFPAGDRPGLVIEDRTVSFSNDLSQQLKVVVEELARGSQIGLGRSLPEGTRVLEVFVTARGVAYVDLSKEAATPTGLGSDDELITVYSVVNSLTSNFPAVKRVQIVIEDRQVPTLAGHVDLTRPLAADMTYLAAATLTPAASPEPAAPSAASAPPEAPPS